MQVYQEVTPIEHEQLVQGGKPYVETDVVICGPIDGGYTACDVPRIAYVRTRVRCVCLPPWVADRIMRALEDRDLLTYIEDACIIDEGRLPKQSDIIRQAIQQHDTIVEAAREAVHSALSGSSNRE